MTPEDEKLMVQLTQQQAERLVKVEMMLTVLMSGMPAQYPNPTSGIVMQGTVYDVFAIEWGRFVAENAKRQGLVLVPGGSDGRPN